jgi:hypothetical protein
MAASYHVSLIKKIWLGTPNLAGSTFGSLRYRLGFADDLKDFSRVFDARNTGGISLEFWGSLRECLQVNLDFCCHSVDIKLG